MTTTYGANAKWRKPFINVRLVGHSRLDLVTLSSSHFQGRIASAGMAVLSEPMSQKRARCTCHGNLRLEQSSTRDQRIEPQGRSTRKRPKWPIDTFIPLLTQSGGSRIALAPLLGLSNGSLKGLAASRWCAPEFRTVRIEVAVMRERRCRSSGSFGECRKSR